MLELITLGSADEHVLFDPCDTVEDFSIVQDSFDEMIGILKKYNGVGLAANQVGIRKNFFIMRVVKSAVPTYRTIVNPRLVATKGRKTFYGEGCLSAPGFRCDIKSAKEVKLHFQNQYGEHFEEWFKGFEAEIVMHELSHLAGVPRVVIRAEGCNYGQEG